MDPILQLYEAMKGALASGHSVEDVNKEIARRGFTVNGGPATFADLSNRANEIQSDRGRGPITPGTVLGAASHAATLGADKYILGAMGAVNPADAQALGVDPNLAAGERYSGTRDAVQRRYEDQRARHPGVTALTELGTGLLTTPALGGPSKTLLGALGKGAAVGAGYGAVSGFMDAPPGERLQRTATGAGLGALLAAPFAAGGHALSMLSPEIRAGNRLATAVDAEGGPRAVRAEAQRSIDAGRGNVNPVGSLGPYLRSEAEFAATRDPGVYARNRDRMVGRQMDETDRLTRDVSDAFGTPQVGREALAAGRKADFDPVYEALNKSAGRIEDPRVENILARPVVKSAYQEAINTGIIGDQVESLPSFGQLKELQDVLFSIARSLENSPGGNKRRMAALYDAAHEIESVLETNVPDFRAIQSAYREASRPINVIDLARLEEARAGRASPALDRASREDRRALMRAFGSSTKYRAFMRAVEQERQLADFNSQVFGGSATARRLETPSGIQPEDLAHTVVHPAMGGARVAGHALGKAARAATAREMAPALFGPSADIDRILSGIVNRRSSKIAQLGQVQFPAAGGILAGALIDNPDDYERDINGYLVPKRR